MDISIIEKNREEITALLRSTRREGIDDLILAMHEGGFFTAPCSGKYHLAEDGGLAAHSLNVYRTMCAMSNALAPEMFYEDLIIPALLHDLGKMGQFGKPNYVVNMIKDGRPTKAEPEQKYKQSEAEPFKTNPDLMYIGHEVRSVAIASRYINLTEEEQSAILFHNGLYGSFKYEIQGKEFPLYMLLHFSDMWVSRVTEVENEKEDE